MNVNVRLRSNVYVRNTCEIRQDMAFQKQVRGYAALRKMVAILIPYPAKELLKERLTPWQYSQYFEPECPYCNCQIYGPIRVGVTVLLKWRRPPEYCECWEHIE